MIKVVMNGCFGHMSSATQEAIAEADDVCVVAGVGPHITPGIKAFPVYRSLYDVEEDYDIIADFSVPDAVLTVCDVAVKKNKRILTGTTGIGDAHFAALRAAAQKVPVFSCFNVDIGMLCFLEMIREAMKYYRDWDIEVIDQHHSQKRDAPSGVCHHIMDIIKEAKPDAEFVTDKTKFERKKKPSEVGVSCLRSGTMVGYHHLIFGGQDEYFEIKHSIVSRKGPSHAAVNVIRWTMQQPVGFYTPEDIVSGMKNAPVGEKTE